MFPGQLPPGGYPEHDGCVYTHRRKLPAPISATITAKMAIFQAIARGSVSIYRVLNPKSYYSTFLNVDFAMEKVRETIAWKIRRLDRVRSTLTMIVVEG
jgi:hypothetical protein